MRILLVGDYPSDSRLGSTKVLLKLQEEFRGLDHHCDVLLAEDIGRRPANGYLRQAIGPVAALAAVREAFRKGGPYDVIDVASAEGLWIGASGTFRHSAVISRSNGLEHLNYQRMIDDHDHGLLRKPWTRRLFHPMVRLSQVAAAARAADRLLLLNDGDRAFAIARGWKSAERIDVIPHGVSSRFLADAPPPAAKRGNGVLFCGSWTGVKGVHYLAQAFTLLVRGGSTTRLTILGGGVVASTILGSFPDDVRPRVTVADRTAEEGVIAAYRSHDVLVWPSTYEGFGMVLVEAMSQRLPVIATPVGCARRLVADRQTGLHVAPRDSAALAAAMTCMLEDDELRTRCASAAFDRVRGMTWTSTARQTLAAYERALGQCRVH